MTIRYPYLILCALFQFCLITNIKAQNTTLAKADSLYHISNYSDAIRSYQKISQKDQYIYLQMARAHKAKGTYSDALELYKKILEEYKANLSTKVEYAKLLKNTSKYETADSLYTILTSNHPKNPDFQYQLGIVKKKLNDTLAISYFKKAFLLDSTHQKSCFEISKYYLKKKEYDLVLKTTNIGLQSYPENVELISVLGQSFLIKKNYYEALPYFEKLFSLNQKNEFVHNKLALCYSQTREYKKAIPHFLEAIRYDAKSANLYTSLGYSYQQLEKHNKALTCYKKALALKDTPIEDDLFSIAMSYRFLEKWEQAIKYIKLSLKENPDYSRGHYQLAMLADVYYKDPKIKLKYYNTYLKKFESDLKLGYFTSNIKKRAAQLEEEIEKNSKDK